MTSHEIAAVLGTASEDDKAEFAHFLVRELSSLGLSADDATLRRVVAALDRFAAPEGGKTGGGWIS